MRRMKLVTLSVLLGLGHHVWAQDEDYSRFESSEEEAMEAADENEAPPAEESEDQGEDSDWRKAEDDE